MFSVLNMFSVVMAHTIRDAVDRDQVERSWSIHFNLICFSLSLSTDMVVLQRWCVLLEKHRCAEAPEALRLACAQALALTGAAVVSSSVMGSTVLKSLSTRCVCVAAFFSFSQFIYIFMPKKFYLFFFKRAVQFTCILWLFIQFPKWFRLLN